MSCTGQPQESEYKECCDNCKHYKIYNKDGEYDQYCEIPRRGSNGKPSFIISPDPSDVCKRYKERKDDYEY